MTNKIYFGPVTPGFYFSDIHGPLTLRVPAPDWVPPAAPLIEMADPDWLESEQSPEAPMVYLPDPNWMPPDAPLIEVENPNTLIPVGAVEITAQEYQSLLTGQAEGQEIMAAPDGSPILVERPQPSTEQLATRAAAERDRLMTEAAIRIAPLQDAVDLGDATPSDEAGLLAWKQYRVTLNRITQQPGYPLVVEWPTPPGVTVTP